MNARAKAQAARRATRLCAGLEGADRHAALMAVAKQLQADQDIILAANARDLEAATSLEPALLQRLGLDAPKLATAIDGVQQLAQSDDPVGRTLRATALDDGLNLYQTTVPLGVVACIFESRPDVCIQIPALALRTGNAVLLKGGSEATHTNAAIVASICKALASTTVSPDCVQLLDGRDEVAQLLELGPEAVDLIVPRGGNALVRHIQSNTDIPVLGHAAGVCHIYLDKDADATAAMAIVLDAKTDSPSACNAVETVLVHEERRDLHEAVLAALTEQGVAVHLEGAVDTEFGALELNMRTVPSLQAAIQHINAHGSHHTDAIVTKNESAAAAFVAGVDSASVFVNASTRFADGYRYGLGAEVGISTGKIHARGPVGVDGLLSTKWLLAGNGHVAAAYHKTGFAHRRLDTSWQTERSLHG